MILVPTITNIVNFSLTSCQFHPILKESVISPLLKKSTLDKDELFNYRPIFNVSVISNIIKLVVKSRDGTKGCPHSVALCERCG